MRLLSWLGGPNPNPSRRRATPPRSRSRRKPAGCKLSVEFLEDRSVPSFLAPMNYAAGTNPQAVITGDFNGDGRLDLAVANYSDSTVSILLGNSDGTFK